MKNSASNGLSEVSSVPDEALDGALIKSVPVEWARQHNVLPIRHEGAVCMLSSSPDVIDVHEELEMLLGQELVLVLSSEEIISDAIQRAYFSQDSHAGDFFRA